MLLSQPHRSYPSTAQSAISAETLCAPVGSSPPLHHLPAVPAVGPAGRTIDWASRLFFRACWALTVKEQCPCHQPRKRTVVWLESFKPTGVLNGFFKWPRRNLWGTDTLQ